MRKNGVGTILAGRPYRRFSHGWGWDPTFTKGEGATEAMLKAIALLMLVFTGHE